MFFNLNRKLARSLKLEDARFSAEDLFALLGGYDKYVLTAGSRFLDVEDEENVERIAQWRKKLASRMEGTGLIDATCTPSDELTDALLPLVNPGLAVIDGKPGTNPGVGVFISEEGRTIVKRAGGFFGGWSIRPIDPELSCDDVFREAFGIKEIALSSFEGTGFIKNAERDFLIDAINAGDEEALRSMAWLHGIPADGLFDLSEAFGRGFRNMPDAYNLWASDTTGCEFELVGGIRVPYPSTGYLRTQQVTVVPEKGFFMKIAHAPAPGDPFDYQFDVDLFRSRTYCQAGFIHEGEFFEGALAVYEWFPSFGAVTN